MKKQVLSLLLALAMLLTLLPQAALSASASDYSGYCGDSLSWTFDPDTGLLAIEGVGDMWDFWDYKGDSVSGNYAPWGGFYERITALSLPDGLSSVGACAFANCSGLTELTLPGSLTWIGWWGFGGCTGLTEVTLPESVEYLSNYAFGFNESLRKITFLNSLCSIAYDAFWGRELTVYGYTPSSARTFAQNNELPFVSLGEVTLEGVCGDDLSWRFDYPSGLLSIEGWGDMWDFAETRGDGFYSASTAPWRDCFFDVTAISLPEDLTSIGAAAFTGCYRVAELELPAGVTIIGDYAFGACSGLTGLVLPEALGCIGKRAFSFCESLTEVTIPEHVDYVGDGAFGFCSALRSIVFLNRDCTIADDCLEASDNVTVYGYSFSSAEGFAKEHELPFVSLGMPELNGVCGDDLTWSFDPETGLLLVEGEGPMYDFDFWEDDDACPDLPWEYLLESILRVSLPEGLTHIGDHAFGGGGKLTAVNLPQSLLSIGDSAFHGCTALTALEFPEGLTQIGELAFDDCNSLTELRLPDGLRSLGRYAFADCDSLQTVTLSGPLEEAQRGVFGNCSELTLVRLAAGFRPADSLPPIPALFYDYMDYLSLQWGYDDCWVTRYEVDEDNPCFRSDDNGVLYSKDGSVLIAWPNEKSGSCEVPEGVKEIAKNAFFHCGGLSALSLPASLEIIRENAFSFCTGLTELQLPAGLRQMEFGAFSYCSALAQLSFPVLLAEIPDYAFRGCIALQALELPLALHRVGEYAFYGCEGLSSVRFGEALESIEACAFYECSSLTELRCPKSLSRIGVYAFSGCSDLRSVKLPGVRELGVGAFQSCWDLREIVFGDPACITIESEYYEGVVYTNESGEDLEEPYAYERLTEFRENLGVPAQTMVFAPHDAENANAEPFLRNLTETEEYRSYELWSFLEHYANTHSYPFFSLGVFSDVTPDSYYELPVAWAVEMGITSGTGDGSFSPKKTCTREQIVTFLWKAAGSPAPEAAESPFSDVTPGKYYYKAVLWAAENKITGGVGEGKFGVGRPCTREQAMSFLWKSIGSPEPESAENPFADVQPGKYYDKAVRWAVENGVTGGVAPDSFGVGKTCTRAQIVTFLYKTYRDL